MLTLIKAVAPEVRCKLLLQKVKTFDEACKVVKNEEQAWADTKKCSQKSSQEAEVNTMSGYKKDQRAQHSEKFSSQKDKRDSLANFKPFCCIHCHSKEHLAYQCPALEKTCKLFHKQGLLSYL